MRDRSAQGIRMLTRQLRLVGPSVFGTKVNGPLLREILIILIDGSQRALRIRTQGRSTARGVLPDWIAAATEFSVEIREGSTVLEIESPSLFEAAPEDFRQAQLFPEIDPTRAAVDYLADSIEAALRDDSRTALYDASFLKFLAKLEGVFNHGVTEVEFRRLDGIPESVLQIQRSSVSQFRQLESRIPRPQRVNVAGKLDTIRHSDRTFVLALSGDQQIRGIAEHCEDLQNLWGKSVLVSGTAHFTVGGCVQRIEADALRLASDRDFSLFSEAPRPVNSPIEPSDLRRIQGPRSGLNAIFGKWPGQESDEKVGEVLDALS
jgi:hypothetical protein